jgi:hypothetical protein
MRGGGRAAATTEVDRTGLGHSRWRRTTARAGRAPAARHCLDLRYSTWNDAEKEVVVVVVGISARTC